MRITKEKKQENYERIITIASELFRERGYDGVAVAELMERAGLTHGGFYNHFRSKEELIAAATARGFGETAERYAGYDALAAIEAYISREHRDARGHGCPAAALSCEAARLPDETRSAFAAGIENLLSTFEGDMTRDHGAGSRALTISLLAQAVGAIVLSRACPDNSSLADEILDACRADCRDAIGNHARKQ
ncbi:TetR family transcriptional regulator [Rhizobium leguminosarum bv. viciae]|uniref:TetR family transcriptional regulator n=1 Tax=Rhizobium leguminosarum TaxID=384 RepID=UPI001441C975|nr:TetR family transcriptional regulator [Rhizobium leguminosarum bv. viciae]